MLDGTKKYHLDQQQHRAKQLPVSELKKPRPEHFWRAIEKLVAGRAEHNFPESTYYDLLTDDGHRLSPKAVFGVAAQEALGIEMERYHFRGETDSPCFRIMKDAGYKVVPKGGQSRAQPAVGAEHLQSASAGITGFRPTHTLHRL